MSQIQVKFCLKLESKLSPNYKAQFSYAEKIVQTMSNFLFQIGVSNLDGIWTEIGSTFALIANSFDCFGLRFDLWT